jgi:hypothetical protein
MPSSTASQTQAIVALALTASMPWRLHASWQAVTTSRSSFSRLAPKPAMVL